MKNEDMFVTFSLNADVEGRESHHHVLVLLCWSKTSVASFILTILDKPADEQEGENNNVNRDCSL